MENRDIPRVPALGRKAGPQQRQRVNSGIYVGNGVWFNSVTDVCSSHTDSFAISVAFRSSPTARGL